MGKRKPVFFFVGAIFVIEILRVLSKEYGIISPQLVTLIIDFCALVAIIAVSKLSTNLRLENTYARLIVPIFLIYQLIVITRGFSFSYEGITKYIQINYIMWPLVIPLLVFFDKDLVTFAHLFKAISVVAVFGIILSLAQPKLLSQKATVEPVIHSYAFACGFILLNGIYLPKKMRIIATLALCIGIAAFVYTARRNGIVSYAGLLLGAIFLNLRNSSASKVFQIIPITGIFLVIALLSTDYLPESFTKKIQERATEDTRTGLFESFFLEMKDFQIFGKGMDGKYYYPTGASSGITPEGNYREAVDYRDVIENGYLQQYLVGGIVYMVLFQLVTLPAIFLGLFKSKNQFCQACAILIILWQVDMPIFGLPRLTMEYILVWIGVGVCFTKSLREKTDDEVADLFLNYKEYESTMVY